MSVNFSPPPGLRGDEKSNLVQMHSFLFRLTEQLNAALVETDKRILETERVTGVGPGSANGSAAPDAGNPPLAEQYESLKSLIIKTAEQVRAEMDVIEENLRSEYTALSEEWGEYSETIDTKIEATAANVVESYDYKARLDSFDDRAAEFESYAVGSKGFIQRGIIDFDDNGLPVYGIAIGQDLERITVTTQNGEVYDEVFNTERSLATYTSDRVTFWSGGIRLAWFGRNGLECVGILTEKINLGENQWEISQSANNGFMIKWIGGED